MPLPHFHWHHASRAFAGTIEIAPTDTSSMRDTLSESAADALSTLARTLGTGAAFCIGGGPDLDTSRLPNGYFVTLTGGTSGTPKAILRKQASWIDSFHINATQFNYTKPDSIAVLGPPSHSLALYGVLEALHLGLDAHVLSPLKPSAQSAQLIARHCSILYATPTQLRLLPAHEPLPDLRLILCGGGALTPAIRSHIARVAPNAKVHVFYGAAETSFITLSDAQTPDGSVGPAYAGVDINVTAPDATGTGLIWVRSPYIFDCYIQGVSVHTKREDGWLTVGEHGRLDRDGYLYLRGRAGRMINIADQTVYPEELEAAYLAVEGIGQCAVLQRPDPLRGHTLVAVLCGPDNADLRVRVLSHCKAHGLIAPRSIVFLDPFPVLPSGKPDLQRIADLTGAQI
ncbi:MAG: AMP-binding protein [Sulfitobacter sp.]